MPTPTATTAPLTCWSCTELVAPADTWLLLVALDDDGDYAVDYRHPYCEGCATHPCQEQGATPATTRDLALITEG